MKSTTIILRYSLIFCAGVSLLQACSSRKDAAGGSTNMQNLTAHFNILYNAGELYKESETAILGATPDDYAQVLTVYREPQEESARAEAKLLDSILQKTNKIISEKTRSNYVDDAWLLTGKVNYLRTSFFNAVEYFDYVYKNYPDEKEIRQQALIWKARSLMRLNDLTTAAGVLDTALKYVGRAKKFAADVYATEAQFNIRSGNAQTAIDTLQKAIRLTKSKRNKLRWTFVLAQLEERNGRLKEAFEHYSAVVKSNVAFDMAFNASLSRIRVENGEAANVDQQVSRLRALLKDSKNKEFADQVHYQVAGVLQANGREEDALKEYNAALRALTTNQNQKGLTYLRLAELNFRNADYVDAKAYYDSTLNALPQTYPGYETIRIKSANLDLLAGRFREIAVQDTLQMLVKLPGEAREKRIAELVRAQVSRSAEQAPTGAGNTGGGSNGIEIQGKAAAAGSKFYFNNTMALSQGLSDFKRRWGNRKLEDNWRRGSGTAADAVAMNTNPDANTPGSAMPEEIASGNETALTKTYTDNLPLTGVQLEQSNQKIINSYYDIAGFYKDELKDEAAAIETYELLAKRFPGNAFNAAVYYNLYRLYSTANPPRSAEYKELLLTKFPGSVYSRIILDPDYSKKADERALALNQAYTDAYNLYLGKNYPGVIDFAGKTEDRYGRSNLSSQFAYLAALGTGRTQKIDPFEASLRKLADTYPDDKMVTPLVKQQLEFIAANRTMLEQRPVALVDFDPASVFAIEPKAEPAPQQVGAVAVTSPRKEPVAEPKKEAPANPVEKAPATQPATMQPTVTQPVTTPSITAQPVITQPVTAPPVNNPPVSGPPAAPPLYSLPDTAEYYFVISVADPRVNLSPSRFGIGQFNRSNFASLPVRHDLKPVNKENQLVLVGKFSTLSAVKAYERRILPMIGDIMKVPAEKYNTFVISKAELDKLMNRNEINSYYDFYRKL
ncbi:tetratricopeptide repeat protein [Hufsiella ginkgonis]|uniref:Tetratricopeptide repeat protein n=1 Tax=Hufsiella ginkgonis TaxID=2695274 RepID=A0A7K1Y3Z1_9SPHI|nr:tetratricopeptide repeat protein [Hufsiella ginkgonis]MXV17587.1 tetratricopeptide repeat protein [Hufsiella ginkgonis]